MHDTWALVSRKGEQLAAEEVSREAVGLVGWELQAGWKHVQHIPGAEQVCDATTKASAPQVSQCQPKEWA